MTDVDTAKWGVPVEDRDSAVGAGWFVEPRCQKDSCGGKKITKTIKNSSYTA
jgi:hypothetical protein